MAKPYHGPLGNGFDLIGSGFAGLLTSWQPWQVLQNFSASLSIPGHQTFDRNLCFILTTPGCPSWVSPCKIRTGILVGSRCDLGGNPGEILAAGIFASRWESWRDSRQDPSKILAAGIFASRWESCRDPGEIPARKKNPGGQNLAGIPAEIAPGSRQDPGSYFTRDNFKYNKTLKWSCSRVENTWGKNKSKQNEIVKDGKDYQGLQILNLKKLGYFLQDTQTVT